MDFPVPAQPGQLPLGVLAGAELHLLRRLGQGGGPVQDGQELLVADGLEGRGGAGDAGIHQGPDLLQEAGGEHGVHPQVNAPLHLLPVPEGQAQADGGVFFGEGLGFPVVLGDGLAGFPVDLQGPEDALAVGGVEPLGALRVHPAQLRQKGLDSPRLQLPLQLGADRAAGAAGGEGAAGDEGVQVEARAARQDGEFVSGQDGLDAGVRLLSEAGRGPALPGVGHGHHVVGDALHFLLRGGGGADGHALVNLHGVNADHLAAAALGQEHAEFGLAAGGGAHDAEDPGLGHRITAFLNRTPNSAGADTIRPFQRACPGYRVGG